MRYEIKMKTNLKNIRIKIKLQLKSIFYYLFIHDLLKWLQKTCVFSSQIWKLLKFADSKWAVH